MNALQRVGLFAILVTGACSAPPPHDVGGAPDVVRITARRFEYAPAEIHLKRGHPVDLELVSLDVRHGFSAPDLGLRADITPDRPTRLHLVPNAVGTFAFHCDVFCGEGHEDMSGEIVVEE